jgi:hypothetical protein
MKGVAGCHPQVSRLPQQRRQEKAVLLIITWLDYIFYSAHLLLSYTISITICMFYYILNSDWSMG